MKTEKIIKHLSKLIEDGKINDEVKEEILKMLDNDEEVENKEVEVEVENETTPETEVETEVENEEVEKENEEVEGNDIETTEQIENIDEIPNEEVESVEEEYSETEEYVNKNDFEEVVKTIDAQTKRIEKLEEIIKELGVKKEDAFGLSGSNDKEPVESVSRVNYITAKRLGKKY